MTIKVGDKMPAGTFKRMTTDGPKNITTDELFAGKKVVIFSVPGAFTPTCDAKHLPGFVERAADLKKKGVDTVACMAVNDVFAVVVDNGTVTGLFVEGPGEFKVSSAEHVLGQL